MKKQFSRILVVIISFTVGVSCVFVLFTNNAAAEKQNHQNGQLPASLVQPDEDVYLELSVTPAEIGVGDILTLHISYHNIGLPSTYIFITPTNVVTYEPPFIESCPPGETCTAVTFRTLAPGAVRFDAYAYGEICCWRWAGANALEPVTVFIGSGHAFLPLIFRDK